MEHGTTLFTAESKREPDKVTEEMKSAGVTDATFQDILWVLQLNEGVDICVGRRYQYNKDNEVQYGGGGNCVHISADELKNLIKSLEQV